MFVRGFIILKGWDGQLKRSQTHGLFLGGGLHWWLMITFL